MQTPGVEIYQEKPAVRPQRVNVMIVGISYTALSQTEQRKATSAGSVHRRGPFPQTQKSVMIMEVRRVQLSSYKLLLTATRTRTEQCVSLEPAPLQQHGSTERVKHNNMHTSCKLSSILLRRALVPSNIKTF